MDIRSISDFREAVRQGPYTWPGGYPLYWIMADGDVVSWDVCRTARREMLEALRNAAHAPYNEWLPVAVAANWETPGLYCAHTGEPIECAYEVTTEDVESGYGLL